MKALPSPVKAAPLGGSRDPNSTFHLMLAAGEEVKVRPDLSLACHHFFFLLAHASFLQAQISTIFQPWLLQKKHTIDRIFIVSFYIYSTKVCA